MLSLKDVDENDPFNQFMQVVTSTNEMDQPDDENK